MRLVVSANWLEFSYTLQKGCYPMEFKFVSAKELAKAIGGSHWIFNRRVRDGEWKYGIHVIRLNERTTVYNLPLIVDWIVNRHSGYSSLPSLSQAGSSSLNSIYNCSGSV